MCFVMTLWMSVPAIVDAQFEITDASRANNVAQDSLPYMEDFDAELDAILNMYWVDKPAVCDQLKALNTMATAKGNKKLQKQTYAFYALCFNPEVQRDSLLLYANRVIDDKANMDSTSLLFAYSALSFLNSVEENLRAAAEYMIESIQYANPNKNPTSIMLVYNEISRIYYNMGFWDKSIEYAHQSNRYAIALNDTILLYKNWSMIAEDYGSDDYGRSETDNAIIDSIVKYRTLAADIGKHFKHPTYRYEHLANQGYLYTTLAQNQEALDYFLQAYDIIKNGVDTIRLSHTLINIGTTYNSLGQYDLAMNYFDRLKEMHEGRGTSLEIEYYYWPRAEAEAALGRYESAYNTMMDLWRHDQNYYDKYVVNEMLRLEEEYQAARKEATIARQNLEIERKNNIQKILGGLAAVLILGSVLTVYIIRRRNRYRLKLKQQELEIKNQQIDQLEQEQKILSMASMIEGQEAERMRIAKDLHDGLGGLLSTVKSHFSVIQKEIKELESLNVYSKTNHLIDEACDEVRRIAHNMMPHALSLAGLSGAIQDLADHVKKSDINCKVEIHGDVDGLDETQSVMVYRIIQEVIANALKHAKCSEILIQLIRHQQILNVTIEDNGIGFSTDLKSETGLGLKSIRSRVNFLEGSIHIDSEPNSGTSVHIEIPVK